MSNGKTYWWAKDAAWLDRERVVELGEEFGPAGPLVLDALCGMAKLENDGGHVLTGWRALARKAFVTPDDARAVVRHAFQIGALDDLDEHADGRRFRCRVSGWQSDQSRGYESVKKQFQRQGKNRELRDVVFGRDGWRCVSCGTEDDLTIDHVVARALGGGDELSNLQTLCGTCNRRKGIAAAVPSCPPEGDKSPSVPKCPPTGQDRTEETPKGLSRHNETPRAPVNLVRIDQEEVA